MTVYIVEADVEVGRVLEFVGSSKSDDDATVICVGQSRLAGWARASLLRALKPMTRLGDAKLEAVSVGFDDDRSSSIVHAGDVELVVDWNSIVRQPRHTRDRATRELIEVMPSDESKGVEQLGRRAGVLARALLAGFAVLPPSPSPITIRTCVTCGAQKLPPLPPDGCRDRDACWLE